MFRTVSLLNSELINKTIKLKKLNKAKKNLKNSNSFNFFLKKKILLLKLNIDVTNIINEMIKENKRAKLPI